MVRFEAPLVAADRGGAFVEVPPDVIAELGGGGRIKVRARFDGVPYEGSVVSMGGTKVIGVLKGIRTELGKSPGDPITVELERDEAERVVDVPDDLATALRKARRRPAFDRLSYSHQREYVLWIDEAKKPETRARRITQTVERLSS